MARKAANDASKDSDCRHLCRCEYQGLRCQFRWVISESTTGGSGVCNKHRDLELKGKNLPDYGMQYAKIVQDSHDCARARSADLGGS